MNFFQKKEEEIISKFRNQSGILVLSKSQKNDLEEILIDLRKDEFYYRIVGNPYFNDVSRK